MKKRLIFTLLTLCIALALLPAAAFAADGETSLDGFARSMMAVSKT